jgi:hypothetical protein
MTISFPVQYLFDKIQINPLKPYGKELNGFLVEVGSAT